MLSLIAFLVAVLTIVGLINLGMRLKNMNPQDKFNAQVAALTDAVNALGAAIDAKLAAGAPNVPVDTSGLDAVTAGIESLTAKLTPPAPPTE